MKLLTIAGILAAAVAPAASEREVFDRSWESRHWAVISTFMEKPRRLAAVLDRDSIQTPSAGLRDFNFVTLSEGTPLRTGIVGRLRIDCRTMTMENLGKVSYYDGPPEYSPPKNAAPVVLEGKGAIYPAALAACTGDFGAMKLIDGDEDTMRRGTFPA